MHPLVESLRGSPTFQQLRYGCGELFYFSAVNRFNHRLPARKVPIQSADADAGAARDFFQARIHSDAGEHRLGGVNQQLPVAGAVDAGFARCGDGLVFGFDRTAPKKILAKRRMPPYINRRFPPLLN
jgi:hypothetical protein